MAWAETVQHLLCKHPMMRMGGSSWVEMSGRVAYPPEVAAAYNRLLSQSKLDFMRDFANRLAHSLAPSKAVAPRGLRNPNVMCFATASIQLLFASPAFVSLCHFVMSSAGFFDEAQREKCPGWTAFCQFLGQFNFVELDGGVEALLDERPAPAVAMIGLDVLFGSQYCSTRDPAQQEDANAFLMHFLDILHEELLQLERLGESLRGGEPLRVQGTNGQLPLAMTHGPESAISDVFGCRVRADTVAEGRTRSVAEELFLVLPLEIGGISRLEDCIAKFLAPDEVGRGLVRKNTWLVLPKSLIFGLKRVVFSGGQPLKLTEHIEFPVEVTVCSRLFALAAVVEHIGRVPTAGHYVCYVRRVDGSWIQFSDERFKRVTVGNVLRAQAYMLLYNEGQG